MTIGIFYRRQLLHASVKHDNLEHLFTQMDSGGRAWCRENRSKILAETFSKCLEKSSRTVIRSCFEKCLIERTENPVIGKVTTKSERFRFSDNPEIVLAVGITSAVRHAPTLKRCVESCVSAGFLPTVFCEPETDTSAIDVPIVRRSRTLGCWRNWIQTMRDLLDSNANAIAIFQDDAVFSDESRRFVEEDLWPSEHTGVVSIYNCNMAEFEKSNLRGCVKTRKGHIMGAVAMIFPRHVAERIATVREWRGRHGTKGRSDGVDIFVGVQMQRMNLAAYFYNPSLVQHIAEHSSIGHGGAKGGRRSATFLGESVSAFRAMKTVGYFD